MTQEIIAISGTRGFLGSNLLRQLESPDRRLIGISSSDDTYRSISAFTGASASPISTFLLSGWSGVQTNFKDDDEIQRMSLERFKAQVTDAHRAGIRRFMGFGSQAEKNFGSSELNLTSYAKRKLEAKNWLEEFVSQHNDTSCTWLRIYAVYGPGMKNSWLISRVARAFATKSELLLGSCTQPWSFLHIDDFVSAVNLVIQAESWPSVIDVANPDQKILRILLESLQNHFQAPGQLKFGDQSPEYSSNADLEYLTELGWVPRWDLTEGVKQLVEEYS